MLEAGEASTEAEVVVYWNVPGTVGVRKKSGKNSKRRLCQPWQDVESTLDWEPQPLVRRLLGTRPCTRSWAAGKWAKLHLSLQEFPITLPSPRDWMSSCKKTRSGLPLTLHYGELSKSFFIYHSVIITEIKYTINVMYWIIPKPSPSPQHTQLQLMEKLSSMTMVPGAKKNGDPFFKSCIW